jgi:Ni,Fe-hydrogenase maturation factor
MKVYVFGNEKVKKDSSAIQVSKILKIKGVDFIKVNLNEDLPFSKNKDVVIMDSIIGISEVMIVEGKDIEKILISPRVSVHDYDLIQLKYLKKLNKIGKVKIIGIPARPIKNIDYFRIQSILRKLVAQDMQGS